MKCQAKVDKYQEKERTGANIVKLDQVSSFLIFIVIVHHLIIYNNFDFPS